MRELCSLPAMKEYYLFPATMAAFYRRLVDSKRAIECYEEAWELVGTELERKFLVKRLRECGIAL